MGLGPQDASQTASMSGRSVTILARRIPSGTARKPEWDGRQELVPALLAGAWNAESPEDQAVLCALAGSATYQEYETKLSGFLRMQDSPLEHEGHVWKVRAPVDMFVQIGSLLGKTDFDRLSAAAKSVFSEQDPSLELLPEERPYAGLSGKTFKHSEWLRDGLANTLRLLAVFHKEARVDVPGGAEGFVRRVIEELPGLKEDWHLIASLGQQIPTLMEAAPRPLLAALGQMLEGDENRIRPIFRDTDALFSSSPHTGLLWGLELTAWDPEHIAIASLLLARLARIDPGGKLSNRPINSLRGIFLPWHPSTNAGLKGRLAALDSLTKHEPGVGWELTLKMLPAQHDFTGESAKPRYREAGASEKEVLTRQLVWHGYEEMIDRALILAGDNPNRWATLVPSIPNFGPKYLARACDLLEAYSAKASSEHRTMVWSAAKELVNRHRAFRGAAWVMPEADLGRLDSIVERLAPTDLLARAAWLFDTDHLVLAEASETSRMDAVDKARERAVGELYNSMGPRGVVSLAERVNHPRFVGAAVPVAVNDIAACDAMVDAALGKSERLNEFAVALSTRARWKFGGDWGARIQARSRDHRCSPEELANLVMYWDDSPATWELVRSMGSEVEASYWRRKPVWPLSGDSQDLVSAIRMYENVGRAVPAIRAVSLSADHVPYEVLFELLDKAMEELNSKASPPTSMDAYEIATLFKSLRRRGDAPSVEIAKREFAYLPFFPFGDSNLALHQLMAEDPGFFIAVLCTVFRPASGEAQQATPEQRARAGVGYRMLSEFHAVPGEEAGQIRGAKLKAWVDGVRQLAQKEDRAVIADEYIGHVLAYAPTDLDGGWPHRAVRDLLEWVKSDRVEAGIQIERANMRGVVTKAMYEGGDQERVLANQAREWAAAAAAWPRTCGMLSKIGEMWDIDASYEDQRARQDEMKYE